MPYLIDSKRFKRGLQEYRRGTHISVSVIELDGLMLECKVGQDDRDRLKEINKELLAACRAVSRLDYLQEHNALAQQLKTAIAKAEKI